MKARAEWLIAGDRNTTLYHRTTIQRRRYSRIEALKDDMGQVISDDTMLKDMVVRYFANIYCKESTGLPFYPYLGRFPSISGHIKEMIQAEVRDEDIRIALFEMKPLKAPGIDGLNALFLPKSMGECRKNSL